jgi:D-beta-D-heptose 7-phosphate kinase/D-beta-D-heptose 1-phosphate adenosyltransferase
MELTRARLDQILERMRGRRIAVIGDAMLDQYLIGDTERLSPEAPVPVVSVRDRRSAPGGAANVAANIVALGAQVALVGVLGSDPGGQALRVALAASGIPEDLLVTHRSRRTTVKTRVIARGQQVVRIDEEDDGPLDDAALPELEDRVTRAVEGADAVILEDYNKGVLTPVVIRLAIDRARARHLPIVVDPKFQHFFDYRGATLFKPNRRELAEALGAAIDLARPEALRAVYARLEVDWMLLTLGAGGMQLVGRGGETHAIPSRAREVFDISGAGDTVTAWSAAALAAGATALEAALAANLAASIEVGKAGVATVSPAEVLAAAAAP